VARLAGLSPDEVARREGGSPPLVETEEETIVKMTERVITEAANEGRVVLVGRGAQVILAMRPNALHVYVIASKAFRKNVAVERLGVDPSNAQKVMEETDRQRDEYVKTRYGRDRQDLTQYDIVLNAERLRFDGAAELIVAEVRRRGWS